MRHLVSCILVMLHAAFICTPANAWSRPGHMVTAAIAWHEIEQRRPELLTMFGELLLVHPDRGAFQVAIDRTTGTERARRLFIECARWPDDARGTVFDHPGWHASLTKVHAEQAGAPAEPAAYRGQAQHAVVLAYATLVDEHADTAQRAQALCWMLHVIGDLHQPLHVAEFFSTDFPQGDGLGAKRFVKDPLTGEPTNLHWLWDDSVLRSGAIAAVDECAGTLLRQYPRRSFRGLIQESDVTTLISAIRVESIELARTVAFLNDLPTSASAATAPSLSQGYWRELHQKASQRVALAGYRLADLVIEALEEGNLSPSRH